MGPSEWTEHFDSNDRVFYYNATMRMSSWTHPLECIYRETYKTIVNFRNANMTAQERSEKLHALQLEVKQMENDVHTEIKQWTEHSDEQGNRFYFNREERQSTWTDPRPAKCQILYLKMKMIRLLQTGSTGCGIASLTNSDFEDQAFKRPKVGSVRAEAGGNFPWPGQNSSETEGAAQGSNDRGGADSPTSAGTPGNSDSDGEAQN